MRKAGGSDSDERRSEASIGVAGEVCTARRVHACTGLRKEIDPANSTSVCSEDKSATRDRSTAWRERVRFLRGVEMMALNDGPQ
jgi:hypothetical protein